jgi:hypothetical protein
MAIYVKLGLWKHVIKSNSNNEVEIQQHGIVCMQIGNQEEFKVDKMETKMELNVNESLFK